MERELLILRHAKSDWDSHAPSDFERPLAKRGRKDAPRVGKWLKQHVGKPDLVVSSPAARARETAVMVAEKLGVALDAIRFDDRLYLADVDTLLGVLVTCSTDARRVLLVGHNPGLEDLLVHLCGDDCERTATGKLLTTAALARLRMPEDWSRISPHSAKLLGLIRPREL